MQAHATYQFRAYARKSGYERLESVLEQCAVLYNAAIQERRDSYKMCKVAVSYVDQQKQFTQIRKDFPEWGNISLYIGRGVLRRVDRAFQSFFRRVRVGEAPGFPRFKPRHRYRCIEILQIDQNMVWTSMDKGKAYLYIKGLPILTMRLKGRSLPSIDDLKTIRIVKRPAGWYVDLLYDVDKEPLPANGESVGIDMGINKRLTLSDGEIIPRRTVDRTKLENLQRATNRCERHSNRRKKVVRKYARECFRNQIRNRNECHRITTDIIRRYEFIGIEDLSLDYLTTSARGTVDNPGTNVAQKAGLNRSIYEQTWGMLKIQLTYKAEWASRMLVEVDPKYTSRTCSDCGERRTEPLPDYGVFECNHCGLVLDRDVNAAINILNKAFEKFMGREFPQRPQGRERSSQRLYLGEKDNSHNKGPFGNDNYDDVC